MALDKTATHKQNQLEDPALAFLLSADKAREGLILSTEPQMVG